MFNRYAIRNMRIEILPQVSDLYSGTLELLYFHEMIKRKYGKEVKCNYEYRNLKQDEINLSQLEERLGIEDNTLTFGLIYKKTVIHTENTDYEPIMTRFGVPNRRLYYSASRNSLIVFIEKKIEFGAGRYAFLEEIFDYTNIMTHMYDCENNDWYIEFKDAWQNNNVNAMREWLQKYFPRNEDPSTYTDQIKQFFGKAAQSQIDRIKREIENNINTMRNYMVAYNRENEELNANRIKLLAYQNKSGCQDELIQVFKDMPNAKIVEIDTENSEMLFTIETNLTSFDPDKMVELLRCDSNYVSWRSTYGKYNTETRKKILSAIFCESPRYVLRVKQTFAMNPNMDIYAKRGSNPEDNCIANPHLNQFSCFGGNGVYIQQAFHDSDFAQGISLLTASVANINLMEDISMKYLWADLFDVRTKDRFVLDNTTGELISIDELVERLNNPEEEKDEFAEEVKRVEIPVDVFNPEEAPYDVQYTRRAAAEEAAAALGVRLAPVEEPAVDTDEDPIEVLREMEQVEEEMTEPTEEEVEATRRLIEQRRANQNMREIVTRMNNTLNGITTAVELDEIRDRADDDVAANEQAAVEYLTEEEFDREFVPTFNQADRNEYRWRDTV